MQSLASRGQSPYSHDYARSEKILLEQLSTAQERDPLSPTAAHRLYDLAHVYELQGKVAESESTDEKLLAAADQLTSATSYQQAEALHSVWAESLRGRAFANVNRGKFSRAEAFFQKALAVAEKGFGPDHLRVTPFLLDLAQYHRSNQRYSDAEPVYRRLVAVQTRVYGPTTQHLIPTLLAHADCLRHLDRPADADALTSRAAFMQGRLE
ncbi:MAG: tetratricopeptide repeat protein [bacterium]